jgi:hypothetical protein
MDIRVERRLSPAGGALSHQQRSPLAFPRMFEDPSAIELLAGSFARPPGESVRETGDLENPIRRRAVRADIALRRHLRFADIPRAATLTRFRGIGGAVASGSAVVRTLRLECRFAVFLRTLHNLITAVRPVVTLAVAPASGIAVLPVLLDASVRAAIAFFTDIPVNNAVAAEGTR